MTSLINRYFKRDSITEQNLFDGLKTESIKVMGRTYYYLPRTVLKQDLVLGEDVLSRFDLAIPIEMYMLDNEGFAGDREVFTKFGLEIHNSYKLVISVSRWNSDVQSQVRNTAIALNRPQEGDLVYDPLTQFLMEIKFVDHDTEFFQLGKNYLYHLSCEAFQYSSEPISTGIPDIDIFEQNSMDTMVNTDYTPLTDYGTNTITTTSNITHSVSDPFNQ